jgi:hypothetical protein
MSSRQEEKDRRRREREEQEAKASASASRTRRLQIVGGAVLAVAVIVVAVLLVFGGGGDDGGTTADSTPGVEVTLPPRQIENLQEAADAAGCTYKEEKIQGSTHVNEKVEYDTNPPTSGNHNPNPAADGVYDAENSPEPENYVHSLEHGRIIFQYKPNSPQRTVATLVALYNEPFAGTPGYHALVLQNNTGMKDAVAATAWGQSLTCPELNDEAIDAMRAFRERFTDKGPEFVA